MHTVTSASSFFIYCNLNYSSINWSVAVLESHLGQIPQFPLCCRRDSLTRLTKTELRSIHETSSTLLMTFIKSLISMNDLSPLKFLASCMVTSSQVTTLDNETYANQFSPCYSMVSSDCGSNPLYGVFVRRTTGINPLVNITDNH